MKYLLIIFLFFSLAANAQPWKRYAKDYRYYGYLWADTLKQTYNLAYNATTWNGNLGIPTMDAIRDKFESLSGGGITSINGLTNASQTFTTGAGGSDFNISSSGSIHTFNIPTASASNRGVVTTTNQTFAGAKTFSDGVIINTDLAISIGGDATGDTYYRGSGGSLTKVAAGSDGDVYTMVSGAPAWATPATPGDLTTGAVKTNIHVVSDANYTVSSTDYVILYSSMTTGRTLTLPSAASSTNRMLIIKNGGSGSFSITTSQTLRENAGVTGNTVPVGSSYGIVSDGTDWWIIWIANG